MSTFGSEIDPDFRPDQSCAPKKAAERSGQKLKRSHDGPVLAKNPGPGPGPSLALTKTGPLALKIAKNQKNNFLRPVRGRWSEYSPPIDRAPY